MTTAPRTAGALAGLALLLGGLLGGCGDGDAGTAREAPPTLDVPPAAQPVVDDLVAQGVDAAEIDEVEVEQVTWSDTALGCAEPGGMYAETTVDGLRVTVTAGARTYEYHQGGDREPFLCERPSE